MLQYKFMSKLTQNEITTRLKTHTQPLKFVPLLASNVYWGEIRGSRIIVGGTGSLFRRNAFFIGHMTEDGKGVSLRGYFHMPTRYMIVPCAIFVICAFCIDGLAGLFIALIASCILSVLEALSERFNTKPRDSVIAFIHKLLEEGHMGTL